MAKNFVLIYVFTSILIFQSLVFGDVVYLNNGREVEGEIIEDTDKAVTLKIKIGQVTFKKDEIKSIDKKELPFDFFGDTSGGGTFKEGPRFTEESKAQKFNLSIKAEYRKLSSGDAIIVEGTTDLPPNTILWFNLKRDMQIVETQKVAIKESPFSVKIGKFSKNKIPPASYVVEVIFSPAGQEDGQIKEKIKGAKEITATYEVAVGTPNEAASLEAKRKSELISLIKDATRTYDDLMREHEVQKGTFNKASWNTSALKWRSKIDDIKSWISDDAVKMKDSVFSAEEYALNEVAYYIDALINRYTEALFKANNLRYDIPPWSASRDIETLNNGIKEKLVVLNTFVEKSEKPEKGK